MIIETIGVSSSILYSFFSSFCDILIVDVSCSQRSGRDKLAQARGTNRTEQKIPGGVFFRCLKRKCWALLPPLELRFQEFRRLI